MDDNVCEILMAQLQTLKKASEKENVEAFELANLTSAMVLVVNALKQNCPVKHKFRSSSSRMAVKTDCIFFTALLKSPTVHGVLWSP